MINKFINLGAYAFLVFSTVACNGGSDPLTFSEDILGMPSKVQFEYGAYNIAMARPYDTVTLKVNVFNVTGDTLALPIRYEVANTIAMSIDSNGVLKSKGTTSGSIIRALVTVNEVTRYDSVYVSIVEGTPIDSLKRLTLSIPVGDSAKLGYTSLLSRGKNIAIVKEGYEATNLSSLKIALSSSNTSIATITQSGNNANIRYFNPGKVYLNINTYAYGSGFRDSIEYTLGWPVSGYVSIYQRTPSNGITILDFHPTVLIVGVGACVTWTKGGDKSLLGDIIFEDSMNVSSPAESTHCYLYTTYDINAGNISPWTVTSSEENDILNQRTRGRVFKKPGLFKYRSKIHGTHGEIYVCDEINDVTCRPQHKQ